MIAKILFTVGISAFGIIVDQNQLRIVEERATFRLLTAGLLQAIRSTDYAAPLNHEGRL